MKKERGPKRGEEEGESVEEERRGEEERKKRSGLEKEEPLVTLPYRTAAGIAIAIRSRQ